MTRYTRRGLVTLALLIPSVGILLLHAEYYLPFLSDDALISLRYAARLLEGKGLTWTDGRAVEGYSNLLWILLVAVLGRLGVDLIDAARILGVLGMSAAMWCLSYWYVATGTTRNVWLSASVGLLFLSLGTPVAVWSIGGLEQPLCAALLAAAIPLTFSIMRSEVFPSGRLWWLSLVLGLLCISRPDGPLFAAATAVSLVLAGPLSGRRIRFSTPLFTLTLPLAFSLGQLAFRFYYYGETVPNTALVKITPSVAHWLGGRDYLDSGIRALAPFSWLAIACLIVLVVDARTRAKGAYLLCLAVAWSAYVVFIGGDIFPAYRHWVPLMIVFAFALVEGAVMVASRFSTRPLVLCVSYAAVVALLFPYTQRQLADKHNQRALRERWEWEGKELALLLKGAFSRQQPLLAVTAAGCLPYWSELPALDMLGLNDHFLPRHPPADIGKGMVGHELGDGRYVLNRNPDIIVFNVGSPPAYRSGEEMDRMPEFHDRYVPATVKTQPGGFLAIVYFNKYSEKIGVGQSESTIAVPGFLLRGNRSIVQLNSAGRLVAMVNRGESVQLSFAAASDRAWLVDHVRASNSQTVRADLKQHGHTVTVTLHATTEDVEVQELVLKRARAGREAAASSAIAHGFERVGRSGLPF